MPKDLDIALEVTLGEGSRYQGVYTFQFGQCTGLDDLAVLEKTGFTLLDLLAKQGGSGAYALLLANVIVWLQMRKDPQKSHVTFEMISASMGYGSEWAMQDPGAVDAGKALESEAEPTISE